MKIALPSHGNDLKAAVNPAFGRAKRFVLVDGDTFEYEVIENPALDAPGGAGIKAAQTVVDSGPDVLITFNCGQNAASVLTSAEIKIYEAVPGNIREVVEKFMSGQLKELEGIHPGYHGRG